jgi:hypothetical protein
MMCIDSYRSMRRCDAFDSVRFSGRVKFLQVGIDVLRTIEMQKQELA